MFNAIHIKISAEFFIDIEKIILKFVWKLKGFRIAKTILKKENSKHFTASKLTMKLQQSRQCKYGIRLNL